MNINKEFDNILDECLEQLLVKDKTIEQCLQSYPEQAAELKPLLQTALVAKKVSAIQPRAEFKARARYQFRAALQEVASQKSRPVFGWLPRWAAVTTIVFVFILIGGGTVAAASYSMPDNLLYPVKLATEQVRLTLTFSDIGKAELHAKLANRRVAEIIYMANKGDAQQVEVITQRLDRRLVMLARLASAAKAEGVPEVEALLPALVPSPEAAPSGEARDNSTDVYVGTNSWVKLRMTVARYAINHPAALRAALETVPELARPVLLRTIAISVAGYERALNALD